MWTSARRYQVQRDTAATLALAGALFIAGESEVQADCTCRAQGRDMHHGERLCLTTPKGPRFAVCGMDQNVASWIFSDEPCALTDAEPMRRLASATDSPASTGYPINFWQVLPRRP